MPFKESAQGPSDTRPETYEQYKQEQGTDLKARDLASYFNGEMHTVVLQLLKVQMDVEQSNSLEPRAREELLKQCKKMEEKLHIAHSIAQDTFQALWKKEQHQQALN